MATYPKRLLTETELYSALSLEHSKIRVLDIHANTETSLLTAQIRVVSLSDHPKFVALSYCWGSAAKDEYTHQIIVESAHGATILKIAQTAHAALTDVTNHLGRPTIWIDALCINQSNASEREMQVPLMKDIYSQAMSVYVHLGSSTISTDIAMDWMTHVSRRRTRGIGILGPGSWSSSNGSKGKMIFRDSWTGKRSQICLLFDKGLCTNCGSIDGIRRLAHSSHDTFALDCRISHMLHSAAVG
jgi:hypothetical protein